ncbi:DUF4232 domain-containing protein [Streptomyces sp. NPDC047002]|uniref:DUF4232 domain-containing protein n=1 Tax=Streptomyces sp. NPDC047002 TaxID=3155475 RepID=UPI0034556CCB
MHIRKISALTLVALAASVSLTACGGGSSTKAGSAAGDSDSSASAPASSAGVSSGADDSANGSGSGTANASTLSGHPGAASGPGSRSASGSGAASGTASGSASGGTCRTANLAFSTSGAMAEGELLVNLRNTGPSACTLHGFPGVDLKGRDGTISASRSRAAAPSVSLAPGQETRFTLHYPPNHSGGSGVTFTALIVTPPDETHSHTLAQAINIPVTDGTTPGPGITVDPVGAGK